ncbi:RHS repeat-associated core domain-containing protein [Pseudomonas sp. AA27]|uniref:RHS repeat-associated core domain-containing protein n=1 Tax=Pseudomonas sp. AA27 TaxID=2908652 RepID=UPI001F47429D|nr:RHS repeat-associated core domain-containing protein [Pseudomonas sp. AA27]MCF1489254.1 RHS repeat-associated core domain-containing protein [Pseudomonas sp. AA27]
MAPVKEARQNQHSTTLLSVDRAGSALTTQNVHQRNSRSYTVYGDKPSVTPEACKTGFDGELLDALGGHYLLGNGVRAYAQTLMRFRSPDVLSPFGAGGINTYAYCSGNPASFVDRTGRARDRIPSLTGMAQTAIFSFDPLINSTLPYPKDKLKAVNSILENTYGGPIAKKNKLGIFSTALNRTTSMPTEDFARHWSTSESDNGLSNAISFSNAAQLLFTLTTVTRAPPFYMKASSENGGDLFGIKALGMYKTEEQLVFNLLRPHTSLIATLHDPSTPSWRKGMIENLLTSRHDIKAGMKQLENISSAFFHDYLAYRQPSQQMANLRNLIANF